MNTSTDPGIAVSREGDRKTTPGDPKYFTGRVSITPLFDSNADSAAGNDSSGQVQFRPGARTAWHTHPSPQRLIVTDGTGWVQEWGKKRVTFKEGDVVWIAPGVKHWHGATNYSAMTHTAVNYTVDGSNVEWMEHVTDEQYLKGKRGKSA